MQKLTSLYAVYLSPMAVELLDNGTPPLAKGRCICKQSNYMSIYRFARNLALHRRLPLHNHVRPEGT
jgi:hypothetical protein